MIDQMGDKASAKATMKAAGVPTIPGSEGLVRFIGRGRNIALEIGYPVMLKATAGEVEKECVLFGSQMNLKKHGKVHVKKQLLLLEMTVCIWKS